jgi:hypothetical protein
MENLIGILIMVALFVISALKKKQVPGGDDAPAPKKARGNPMDDEIYSPFKGVFDDDEEAKEQEVVTSETIDNNEARDFKRAAFVKDDYVFTANTSPGDKRRQRKNKTPGRQANLKSQETKPYDLPDLTDHPLEWFDLRKAVIYSEILKRRDY